MYCIWIKKSSGKLNFYSALSRFIMFQMELHMSCTFIFAGIRFLRMGRKRTEKFNYHALDNHIAGQSFCDHTEVKR